MSTIQKRDPSKDLEKQKRDTVNALIGTQLLSSLGKPGNLLTVQVRRIWENCYRVNVLTGADASSAKVANSYFLQADANGNIIESNPKITRQY